MCVSLCSRRMCASPRGSRVRGGQSGPSAHAWRSLHTSFFLFKDRYQFGSKHFKLLWNKVILNEDAWKKMQNNYLNPCHHKVIWLIINHIHIWFIMNHIACFIIIKYDNRNNKIIITRLPETISLLLCHKHNYFILKRLNKWHFYRSQALNRNILQFALRNINKVIHPHSLSLCVVIS